jgi:hypothetical protein
MGRSGRRQVLRPSYPGSTENERPASTPAFFLAKPKNIFAVVKPSPDLGYYAFAGGWTSHMRIFALALVFCAIALPCAAQTALKSEPLLLAPYEIVFVQSALCPSGQVLKVTGGIRGLHRRKTCVSLASEQASLAVATP